MNKKIKKHLLFCQGPVNVAQNVRNAVHNEIGHREKEFSDLLKSINKKLLELYEIKQRNVYQSVVITGSGTAANEAILSSVVGNKHILVLSNGEFGERIYSISKIHNKHTSIMAFQWGEQIDLKKVEAYIKRNSVDIVAVVHHETSTGMLNPIEKIGKLTKKYKKMFIVDTVSSAGAEKIDIEKCNITFCSTSSGKAISCFPGLGIIIGKKDAFEKLKHQAPKTAYLNLYKLYYYFKTFKQTPNTPAVQLFFALDESLNNILKYGLAKHRQLIQGRAQMLRTGMKKLDLEFLVEDKIASSILTSIITPKDIPMDELKKALRKKNIIIYNGKGPLLNKVFQVANIGELQIEHINYFLNSLEEIIISIRRKTKVKNKSLLLEKNFIPTSFAVLLPKSIK